MSWGAGLGRLFAVTVVLTMISSSIETISASAATINQVSPFGNSTLASQSGSFMDALETDSVNPVTYVSTATNPDLTVSSTGAISTTGTLSVGSPYTVSGTDSDGGPDSGVWSYSLTVSADTITQGSTTGTTDVAGSANFTSTLQAASGFVGQVTYVTTATNPDLIVNSSGQVSTTGTLSASGSPYDISGTDSDVYGDAGSWTYALTVTADTIIQGAPTSGTTTSKNSGAFTSALSAGSGFIGAVSFTSSTPGFTVINGNELESTGALSAGGSPYTVTGADSDSDGDSGTWSFALTVLPTGSKTTIVQTSPTTGTVTNASSSSFSTGPITVENSFGPVTFVTTKSSTAVSVSSSGAIATSGSLPVGVFNVSGTDSDTEGDTGTWTYTLQVTGVTVTVKFDGNGGTGTLAPESASEPTELSLNTFKWPGHTFVDWNTSADGSGVSYANGAIFPFIAPTTLFAQWKLGKAPSSTITFAANGGTGSTASEIDNTPTAISPNTFTWSQHTFVDWNTAANGSGRSFKAGDTYSFTKSITLFAQWKKATPRTVTFAPNGGLGTMGKESHFEPTALALNSFARHGYTFVNWNTAPNGSGIAFANGATYPFSTSATLYAQWKKIKKIAPPPPVKRPGPTVGPFFVKASTLTSSLESQVATIASDMKAKGDTQVTLLGYGDELTASQLSNGALSAANVELGRMRAEAVATYLEERLTAIGIKGWTISLAAGNVTASNSINAALVIATLT